MGKSPFFLGGSSVSAAPGSPALGGQPCPSSWSFFLFLQVAQAVNLRGPGALIMPPFFAEEGLLYRARYFGDTDMYHRAQKMGTPSCSRLSEVQASLHG